MAKEVIEVWLPVNVGVVNKVDVFAGSFENHTPGGATGPTLHIEGDVVFGTIKAM